MAVDFVRGCYFSSWAVYKPEPHKFTPEKIPLDLCTHIYYAFAAINTVTFEAQPFDSWADIDLKGYEKFTGLKQRKPELKTLLSFGGWTMSQSGVFEKMAATSASRANFINSAWVLANKYGFDGIDIDWEYPNGANRAQFAALMQELKAASGGKLVTAAVSAVPAKISEGYDLPALARSIDLVNLMTYDYHGTWEPKVGHVAAYSEMADTVHAWKSAGFPSKKMVLGLAVYGRGWTTSDCSPGAPGTPAPAQPFSRSEGIAFYHELSSMGGLLVPSKDGPYLMATFNGQKVCYGFDDPDAIVRKMTFVKEEGLAGAFTWTIDSDNDRFDIHQAMRRGLSGRSARPGKGAVKRTDVDWVGTMKKGVRDRHGNTKQKKMHPVASFLISVSFF